MEVGAFFEGDGPNTGNLTPCLAIYADSMSGYGVLELDPGTSFNAELEAVHLAENFSMAADDEIT